MAETSQSSRVGVIATWLNSDYWLRIVAGATEVLGKEGLVPICYTLGARAPCEPRKPCPFFDLVDRTTLAGIMLISTASFQNHAEAFLQRQQALPAVCVGRRLDGIPSLWVQNALGIRMLMKHLTDVCGRRRIAFIRGTEMNLEAEARFRAWEDFCFERSLPRDGLSELGEFTEATGEAAAYRLLERHANQLPDALVASNDRMALGALVALRKRGLKVPDDISVVGFDDLEADRATPPLTTVRQPVFEMGYHAAAALVSLLQKKTIPFEQMFSPELVVRASCRPIRKTTKSDGVSCGFGARAFLDPAYPSADRLTPALVELSQALSENPSIDSSNLPRLATALDQAAQAGKRREDSLIATVRELRSYIMGRVEQALAQTRSMVEVRSIIQSHLQALSLDALSLALVRDESGFGGEARLVIDCSAAQRPAAAATNCWIPSSQIVSLHAERGSGILRVAQPLYSDEGEAYGFVVTSGALLDSAALSRIGVALSRAIQRIGA